MRLKLQTGKGSCWGGGGASVFFVFPLCLFPKKKIFGLSLFSLTLSHPVRKRRTPPYACVYRYQKEIKKTKALMKRAKYQKIKLPARS